MPTPQLPAIHFTTKTGDQICPAKKEKRDDSENVKDADKGDVLQLMRSAMGDSNSMIFCTRFYKG